MPNELNNPIFDMPFPDVARQQSFVRQFVNGPLETFLDFFGNRYDDIYCNGFQFNVGSNFDPMGSGPPDMFNRPLQYFHKTLCNFCTATPPSSKWAVFIKPENSQYLLSQIQNMQGYEPYKDSNDWNFAKTTKALMSEDLQNRIGCIFALGVNEAGVSVGVDKFGGVNGAINGFTKGSSTTGRVDNDALELVLRETNCSYVDLVLRPWVMLLSHKGLHARPQSESIKATITIFELAGTFPGKSPIIRKVFNYYECAPINVNTETLSYEPNTLIQRQVGFTYGYYTVQDGTGLGFNDQANLNREEGVTGNNTVDENVFGAVLNDK